MRQSRNDERPMACPLRKQAGQRLQRRVLAERRAIRQKAQGRL